MEVHPGSGGRRRARLPPPVRHVVISARDATKADAAIGTLREAVPAGVFDFIVLELASLASVRNAAEDILARFRRSISLSTMRLS